MRLISFFSTVAFCFFTMMGLIAYFYGRALTGHPFRRRAAPRRRPIERVFIFFCSILAVWAFATAFFVSAGTEAEALAWFRAFGFSWFLAPGTFAVFALLLSGLKPNAASAALPLAPGILVTAANFIAPESIVVSAVRVSGGWHPVYGLTFWSVLNTANSMLVPLIAVFSLVGAAASSSERRRRYQARIVLAFFTPTFLCSMATGYVARWFGVDNLPPLTPSFSILLVIGLFIALFRYGLLELTPSIAVDRILSSVSDAVVLIEVDGSVVDSNQEGKARDSTLESFTEGAEAVRRQLERRLETGSAAIETKFAFARGVFTPASVQVIPVSDDGGSTIGYVLTAHDLSTEKSLARESALSSERAAALRSAEENFSRVFRQSPAGMVIVELGTSMLLDVNYAAGSLVEKKREDLIGKNMWSFGLSMIPEILESLRTALREGQPVGTREITLIKENDTPLILAAAAVPIPFDGKKAALISFVDITELSFLRNELFKAQKTESIGAMAAGLAHDFNNILTAIMGNMSLARLSAEDNGEIVDALSSAEAACLRARDLSRQLLLFARGGPSEPQALDLFSIVLETTRMALSGTSVVASFSSEPDLPLASADRTQLSMVFNNLALNAVAAMPAGGTLKVRGARKRVEADDTRELAPGEYLCVEYEDEGEGIAPDRLQRVFDPYMHSKRKNGGLGLAVCQTIVKRHGGFIGVDSVPGRGSTFTVYLPALPKENSAGARGREERRSRTGKGYVLLMDDEFVIRTTAERLFGRLGYESITVADGEAAIRAFKDARSYGRPFSAVVLDITVPGGMGGVDAASVIRSIDSDVPIYASSGYNDGPFMTEYAAFGFSGVIPKPYSLDELAARLAAAR